MLQFALALPDAEHPLKLAAQQLLNTSSMQQIRASGKFSLVQRLNPHPAGQCQAKIPAPRLIDSAVSPNGECILSFISSHYIL